MVEEADLVTQGYLTTLYTGIEYLILEYASYKSILLYLKMDLLQLHNLKPGEQYDILNKLKLNETQENALIERADAIRSRVENTYIHYNSLLTTIPKLKSDKLPKLFDSIVYCFTPDCLTIRDYCIEIHECVVRSTIRESLDRLTRQYEQYAK